MMEEAVCVKRNDTIVSNIDVLAKNLYEAECMLNHIELLLCTKGTDSVSACWNLLWALEQRTTHPELNDMPWAKEENK